MVIRRFDWLNASGSGVKQLCAASNPQTRRHNKFQRYFSVDSHPNDECLSKAKKQPRTGCRRWASIKLTFVSSDRSWFPFCFAATLLTESETHSRSRAAIALTPSPASLSHRSIQPRQLRRNFWPLRALEMAARC